MVYKCTEIIRNALYPTRCRLCLATAEGAELCPPCQTTLTSNPRGCQRCGLPLASVSAQATQCGQCLSHPPPFDSATIPFLYQTPLDQLITRFKFQQDLASGQLLATLLRTPLSSLPVLPDLIIPMPLHPARLRQRGYNQALELARPISRWLQIPLDYRSVKRVIPTQPQAGLDRKARRSNVRGAFSVNRKLAARRVAIVDDVVTTGSTAAELAKTLKRHGAAWVEVWAVARTDA